MERRSSVGSGIVLSGNSRDPIRRVSSESRSSDDNELSFKKTTDLARSGLVKRRSSKISVIPLESKSSNNPKIKPQ